MEKKIHILSAIVENKPGVLNRIVSLLRRRRFNIESISAGYTEKEGITRITFTVDAEKNNIDQVIKQVEKIIDVLKVLDITFDEILVSETALIKVKINEQSKIELQNIIEIYKAEIEDISDGIALIRNVSNPEKISDFVKEMKKFGIVEMVRTGLSAIQKGVKKI